MKHKKNSVNYNNQSSLCERGHSHRSKLESAVCQMIQLREKAGELELLQVESAVYLTEARYKYIPDFKCRDIATGKEIYIEAKGYPEKRWPTTKKLWKFYGPGYLEIWGGSHLRLVLDEVIKPKSSESS